MYRRVKNWILKLTMSNKTRSADIVRTEELLPLFVIGGTRVVSKVNRTDVDDEPMTDDDVRFIADFERQEVYRELERKQRQLEQSTENQ
jgi:hypothetical protein